MIRTLFHLSLSLLLISPFLFFVRDEVFVKWLRFALVWLILSIILVAWAPVSTGGWVSFGPTKELVSLWMGILLMVLTPLKLWWDTKHAMPVK